MSMPTTVWYLLITTYLTYTTESKLNEFIKKTGPNGQDIWESTSDFIPVQSKSFGTIRLGAIMSMEFDFTFWGRTNNPRPGYFEMFFRVGFNASIGTSCNGEGSRFPSFWLTGSSDTMHVSVSESSSCQPYHSLNEYGTIIINTTYHVKIEFNNTELFVSVTGGGKPDWNKTWSRLPPNGWDNFIGQIVPVWWMSDKYSGSPFNIGNGTFRNVTLISNIFTLEPTVAPTYNPTVTPTKFPSVSPITAAPTKETDNPTVSPTISPTYITGNPTVTPIISPTVSPTISSSVSSTEKEDGFDNDFEEGALDGTMVGIIIAVAAVFCCLCCGMIILCRNRQKNKLKTNDTDNKMDKSYKKKQLETEMNNISRNDNPGVEKNNYKVGHIRVYTGEEDYNYIDEELFTPDGVLKEQIIPNAHEQYLSTAQAQALYSTAQGPDDEQYLSPAQKRQLHTTPQGPDVVQNEQDEQDNYNKYLSPAQKHEMRIQKDVTPGGSDSDIDNENDALVTGGNDEIAALSSDDNQTSDEEIISGMPTPGYIGMENVNSNNEIQEANDDNNDSNESLSEMSEELPIENKLTIGGEHDNENENLYNDDEYDDSLSELNESIGVTMQ